MSTYSVANLSGSVGKTTTVVTMGVQLASTGLRVRIIDLDPQANASTVLGYPTIGGKTVADVLRLDASIDEIERPARVIQGYTDDGEPFYRNDPDALIANLTVAPAGRATLDKVMIELPAATGGVMRLRDALEEAAPVDITLIDSPGSNGPLVTTALLAATVDEDCPAGSWGLITCTKPAGKESEGIQALLRELAILKRIYRIDIPLLAIVPCAVPASGAIYREQMEYLNEGFGDKVTPAIRRSAIVDEAYTNYLPVPLYGYRAKTVAADYADVIGHMKRQGLFSPAAINA